MRIGLKHLDPSQRTGDPGNEALKARRGADPDEPHVRLIGYLCLVAGIAMLARVVLSVAG